MTEQSVFLQVGVLKYRPRRGRRAVSCHAYLLLLHAAAGQRDFEALGSLACAELRAWVCFRTGCQPPSSFRGTPSRVMRSLGPLRFLKCGGERCQSTERACLWRHHPGCATRTGQRGMFLQEIRLVRPRIGANDQPACIRGHDPERRHLRLAARTRCRGGVLSGDVTTDSACPNPHLRGYVPAGLSESCAFTHESMEACKWELGALLRASISGISGDSVHAHHLDGVGRADVPKMQQTVTGSLSRRVCTNMK